MLYALFLYFTSFYYFINLQTLLLFSDSSDEVCIENCTITVGHDAISLKSGWDEYGISYNRPTTNVQIKWVYLQASFGAGLAFGSEMSGGISTVHADDLYVFNSLTGIELKTTKGRGGYINDILISNVRIENVSTALVANGNFGSHPDDNFDPNALPIVDHITLKNVVGKNIKTAGNLSGIPESPFTSICLSNISLIVTPETSNSWVCSNVLGFSESVFPEPCADLQSLSLSSPSTCFSYFSGHSSV